jgi:CRP/FNR family transcriptional regulator, cyclic AMP receptor protein
MQRLSQTELAALRKLCDQYGVNYRSGRVIVREDERSTELYVLLAGAVQFTVKDPETGKPRLLRTIHAGEIFGEISCFSGLPRSATALTIEDSQLLRFSRETAIELIRASPEFAIRVIQTLGDRLRANTELLAKVWH